MCLAPGMMSRRTQMLTWWYIAQHHKVYRICLSSIYSPQWCHAWPACHVAWPGHLSRSSPLITRDAIDSAWSKSRWNFFSGRMSSKILFSSLLIGFQSVPLPICLSNNFTNKYRKNNEIIFLTLLSCKKEVEKIRGLPDFLFGCNCCHAPRLIRGEARLSAGVCPDGQHQQFSRLWAQTSSVGFWLRHRKDLPHPRGVLIKIQNKLLKMENLSPEQRKKMESWKGEK